MDQHLDPEVAALAALGEPLLDPTQAVHLATCDSCRHEISALRATVSVARSTVGEHELHAPSPQVWRSIQNELGLSADLVPTVSTPSAAPVPEPIRLDAVRERRASIRRFVAPVLASAAAAALVAVAVVSWGAGTPRDQGVTLASVQLDYLPAWQGATGEATIVESSGGERVMRVALDANVSDDVVREVWLLTENVDGLISLGLLDGPTGDFVIPASVDLDRYSVVDISAEPLDGDPTHSGDSIVRGAINV